MRELTELERARTALDPRPVTRQQLTDLHEDRALCQGELEDKLKKIETIARKGGSDSKNGEQMMNRLEAEARGIKVKIDGIESEITTMDEALSQPPEEDPEQAAKRRRMLPAIPAVGIGQEGSGSTRRGGDLRSHALTINERAERMPEDARQKMALTLEGDADPDSPLARYVIAAGDHDYYRAFEKWARDPLSGHYEWTPSERDAYQRVKNEARAVNLGTGSQGGVLVPYELDPQILISSAGSIDPVRSLARVEQVAYNEARFVTSQGVTSSWDAELSEVSDDSPTFVQPVITCHKGRAFVPVSEEAFEDSDVGAQLGPILADSKAQLEATAFSHGTGTGQPKGLITAIAGVSGSVVNAAGSALTLADYKANQNALPPRWRPRAQWAANLSIINSAREIAKGEGLTESIVDDSATPPKLLGWNLNENSNMDGSIAAGTTNDYVLVSGDFKQYIIADRVGTTIEFIPHLMGDNNRPIGARGFYMRWRTGADVVIADAFRLTNANA